MCPGPFQIARTERSISVLPLSKRQQCIILAKRCPKTHHVHAWDRTTDVYEVGMRIAVGFLYAQLDIGRHRMPKR